MIQASFRKNERKPRATDMTAQHGRKSYLMSFKSRKNYDTGRTDDASRPNKYAAFGSPQRFQIPGEVRRTIRACFSGAPMDV